MLTVWLQVGATIFLGLSGLWLAHSFRRRLRGALVDRAAAAYAKLWRLTEVTTPGTPDLLIGPTRRRDLAIAMDHWYFEDGNGMYLPTRTRLLFFAILLNLMEEDDERFSPASAKQRIRTTTGENLEALRSCLARRQTSLLRAQIKIDLGIDHQQAIFRYLRADETELLSECHIRNSRLGTIVTRFLLPGRVETLRCHCGTCP